MAAAPKLLQFKLVLLGESAVGKSSLVLRFVKGQFLEYQESTIGAAFLTQTVQLNDTTIKFELGKNGITASLLCIIGAFGLGCRASDLSSGAQAAIVVYDITAPESLERAKSWVKELQRQGSPNIVIALAGNKADLDAQRKIPTSEAATYANDANLLFMETSAKTAQNVMELFVAVAKKLPRTPTAPAATSKLAIQPVMENPPPKKGCCG